MLFYDNLTLSEFFEGKRVAIVGSGPGSLDNEEGFIDKFDIVVRVNNYKLIKNTGKRTDVFYSYFGGAIKKTKQELIKDGVKLCIAKCPNSKFIESKWHTENNKINGIDFRYIYQKRKDWWFCNTYVPSNDEFLTSFNLIGKHVPTSGFSAILKIIEFDVAEIYLTGFDFFESNIHNVNESWRKINNTDPIGHRPDLEKKWLLKNIKNHPFTFDKKLTTSLRKEQ